MSSAELSLPVTLPSGTVDLPATWGEPDGPAWAAVVLTHGAGSGREHPFLAGLAAALQERGVVTLRFDLPYRAVGRRMPGPAAHAVAAWTAAGQWAGDLDVPWFASGKSYGGRMASMAAAEGAIDPAGLAYFGYPLHPPGQPAKARVAHLPAVPQPQLFLSGTNDPFVQPVDQLEAAVASCRVATLDWVEGAGHSFEVKGQRRAADVIGAALAPRLVEWMRALV